MPCNDCQEPQIKICEQTHVPQVDESEIECSRCGYVSTQCIVFPNAISYLGLPENSNVTNIIEALVNSLIDARNRIQLLEACCQQ